VIDLHCHVLPGVDDGPPDLDGAVALARASARAGVRTIVATPHADARFSVGAERRDAALAELRGALAAADVAVEVLPGAEIAIDWYVDLDDGERRALRLGDGPYWLLESPLAVAAGPFDRYLATLLAEGAHVLLAHPERCPTFARDPQRLARLVGAGALTSVTAGAFTGRFGAAVRRFAFDLLRDGLVHSVASDAHDVARRPPGLREPLEEAGLGALAPWLTEEVPAAILAGDRLPPRPDPADASRARRPGRLRRLLGG
jgi:protein-tyrosine phosphatase